MSDSPTHKSKSHSGTYFDPASGQTHILRSDNTADGLRLALAKAIEEYGVGDEVTYKVEALDGPWVKLELRYPDSWGPDEYSGLPTDVEKAMQGLPHGYYEVRERGQNQIGSHVWFVARHEGGPLI